MTILEIQSPAAATENRSRLTWQDWLQRLGPMVGLAFVFILFSLLRPSTFLSSFNLRIMLLNTAVVGIAALGMTIIIISGGIDLSVGSNVALCTVIIGLLLNAGFPPVLAALGGILTGTLVGLVIGGLITALQLTPFIVTLGLMGALRGLAILSSKSGVVDPPEQLRNTWIGKLLSLRSHDIWTVIPAGVWMLSILALLTHGMLRYTKFGRHVFAIGSNEQTARLCGINITATRLLIYTLASALVGVAALLQFSMLYQGNGTGSVGLELDVIAAVVIGGASLSGGEGSVLGSMAGALMMTAVANGCQKMGYDSPVQMIVTGGIIIAAAALDRLRHRKSQ
jgi:ribose/xylose/arabinose/galactoside ABC-type transport system permease subunit